MKGEVSKNTEIQKEAGGRRSKEKEEKEQTTEIQFNFRISPVWAVQTCLKKYPRVEARLSFRSRVEEEAPAAAAAAAAPAFSAVWSSWKCKHW